MAALSATVTLVIVCHGSDRSEGYHGMMDSSRNVVSTGAKQHQGMLLEMDG